MEVKLVKKELEDFVDLVSKFVSRNTTLPVLENIYIKAGEGILTLRGTDMSKYIQVSFPANIESEGVVTVNARTLGEFLKTIEDEQILLESDENDQFLKIRSSGDEISIKGIPASEYVAVPEIVPQKSVQIPASYFVEWVKKVEFAVSDRSLTAVLTWILIRFKNIDGKGKLIFAWTDALRLADYRIDMDWWEEFGVIVPKVNVVDITKAVEFGIEKEVENIQLDITDSFVGVKLDLPENKEIYISSVLIEGSFPDYENENIMPTKFNTLVKVSPQGLEKAIKKVVILTKWLNYFVDIKTNVDEMIISSWETDMWEVNTRLKAIVDGQKVEFGVNGKQVLDFLKEVKGDVIDINIVDAERPLIFKDPLIPNYTYIVRPLIK